MKFRNTPRNGQIIIFLLAIFGFILISIINYIPHTDYNSLNQMEKFQYDLNVYNGEDSSKLAIIDFIIVFTIIIAIVIVSLTMCRCPHCNHLIGKMSFSSIYCPYCSKYLNLTKKEVQSTKK